MYRILFLILFSSSLRAQLVFTDQQTDLGIIPEAYEIKGDVILKNESAKKIFLLRADADKGLKVFASKKTLLPNDTCLLVISFIPDSKGKFWKLIKLVASDKDTPYKLSLSGTLINLKQDDKTACFYFGSRRSSNVKIKEGPITVKESNEPRDVSNKIPDRSSEPIVTKTVEPVVKNKEEQPDQGQLPLLEYKPNNIVFLIDVSNSMKDSMKLP